jgi:hypothetical protein
MKKIIFYSLFAALMLAASCQKTPVANPKGNGTLYLGSLALSLDETVETKASEAAGNYTVSILDAEGKELSRMTYADVKANDNKITLPAGNYTLVASSSDKDVPESAFESPVYGTSKGFSIVAGQVTEIGELTCTLLQCKVTVSYSEEFLESVTGPGKATVSLKAGYPLEYKLNADGSFDESAGYFAVEGNTLEVVFQGSIDGQNKKMTKAFTGVTARQWRQIRFIQKKNEQGEATFDVVINDLVSDETLNNVVAADDELVIGEDPEAPKGDGGIKLYPDYEAGCDSQITDLANMLIVPEAERQMSIKLKAEVPNGIMKFNVAITTDNEKFASAVAVADATNLDLIHPSATNEVIFTVVPFPHGEQLLGMTEVDFDLSNAQSAIVNYKGRHTFTMNIVDQTGCRNSIVVVMVVE